MPKRAPAAASHFNDIPDYDSGYGPPGDGHGRGRRSPGPLARALIGGLMSSNLITLFFIPVLYAVFNRRKVAADEK